VSVYEEKSIMQQLHRLVRKMGISGDNLILVLAVVVGLSSGLFAVLLRYAISFVTGLFCGLSNPLTDTPFRLIFPAVGMMAAAGFTLLFGRDALGPGVSQVLKGLTLRGGLMSPSIAPVKLIASSLTIGSGGSAGREGPIVQIGATIGSTVAQSFRMSSDRTRTLVVAGAAAGIAAAFNTPIAGSVFVLEVLLGTFSSATFSHVVVAAVSGAAVTRGFFGNNPAFPVPAYELVDSRELFVYALLGLLAALVSRAFIWLLFRVESLYDHFHLGIVLKPLAAGLIVGGLGLLLPEILGGGDAVIEDILLGNIVPATLILLIAGKVLATSLTVGSGAPGGIIGPTLFTGAALGGALGFAIHAAFPTMTGAAGAYALVGMAALFSAAAQAPITAILAIFELTWDYRIILPLMTASVVAHLVSTQINPKTIFTYKLYKRGLKMKGAQEVQLLEDITVADVMSRQVDTILPDLTLVEAIAEMDTRRHTGLPVVKGGCLLGILTLQDIRGVPPERRNTVAVQEAMTSDLVVAHPEDSLLELLTKMSGRGVERMPVVDMSNPRQLMGIITRSDILKAYEHSIVRKEHQ